MSRYSRISEDEIAKLRAEVLKISTKGREIASQLEAIPSRGAIVLGLVDMLGKLEYLDAYLEQVGKGMEA